MAVRSALVSVFEPTSCVSRIVAVFVRAGDVLRDMGLRDAFNVQLSVPSLNGDAVSTVLRSLDCFNSGEVLQV